MNRSTRILQPKVAEIDPSFPSVSPTSSSTRFHQIQTSKASPSPRRHQLTPIDSSPRWSEFRDASSNKCPQSSVNSSSTVSSSSTATGYQIISNPTPSSSSFNSILPAQEISTPPTRMPYSPLSGKPLTLNSFRRPIRPPISASSAHWSNATYCPKFSTKVLPTQDECKNSSTRRMLYLLPSSSLMTDSQSAAAAAAGANEPSHSNSSSLPPIEHLAQQHHIDESIMSIHQSVSSSPSSSRCRSKSTDHQSNNHDNPTKIGETFHHRTYSSLSSSTRTMASSALFLAPPSLSHSKSRPVSQSRLNPSIQAQFPHAYWKRVHRQSPVTSSIDACSNDDGSDSEATADMRPTVEQISKIHGYLSSTNIDELLRRTNYSRRELYVMYGRFKALCALSGSPLGIDKETFKKGVARLAVEDELFVDRVFDLVDQDGSGCIEWDEFLTALSALEKGSAEIKTKFLMSVYDLDGDGFISRQDLSMMFLSSSMLANDRTTQDVCLAFVDTLFEILGVESNRISAEHITDFMAKNPGKYEDVWELLGRSMLKDFSQRRGGS